MLRRITFKQQAAQFMKHAKSRTRKPIKPATTRGFESILAKWLLPNIGEMNLAEVNNGTLRDLISMMKQANLSAQTIITYTGLVKLIVASAVNENGEELFARKWNSDFMDLPILGKQHQPVFTAKEMSAIVQAAVGEYRVLYALLAGSGLRIGEALGLEVKHFDPERNCVTVQQSCWQNVIQIPKTPNAIREVDVDPLLGGMIQAHLNGRTSGFLFTSRSKKPLRQSNILRRHLHPLLTDLGIEPKGFHAFRRFRATWLRRQQAPEDLIRFWMGHSKSSITDSYVKLNQDVDYRKSVIEHLGVGFELLPSKLAA